MTLSGLITITSDCIIKGAFTIISFQFSEAFCGAADISPDRPDKIECRQFVQVFNEVNTKKLVHFISTYLTFLSIK
jgi:hypothetical protein